MLGRSALATIPLTFVLVGCSNQGGGSLSPEAERGRQVYLAQCTACHAQDPAQNGPLGPAVKGSSRELL
jgi:mono/diheme cytochrome c family protein